MKNLSVLFLSMFLVNYSHSQDEINFEWVQIALGGNDSYTRSIDTDDDQNIYHCGTIQNYAQPDFTQTDSVYTPIQHGYISKVSSSGEFIWGKTFISSSNMYSCPTMKDIRVLNSGEIICALDFLGTVDFDPSSATYEATSIGGVNTAILKLDSDGNFIWLKSIEGEQIINTSSYMTGLAIDDFDNIYLTGSYAGTYDFDPGIDTAQLTTFTTAPNSISRAGYLLKWNVDGDFQWVKNINGPYHDALLDVEVDNNNEVITAGYFYDSIHIQSQYLDTVMTSGWFTSYQQMILKYDSSGEALWVKRIGTSNLDVNEIVVDPNNNFSLVGNFQNGMGFGTSVNDNLISHGASDGFIANFSSSGLFNWAHNVGSFYFDWITSVELLENGNYLVAVHTKSDSVYYDSVLISDNKYNGVLLLSESGNLLKEIPLSVGVVMSDIKLDGAGGLISSGHCISDQFWPVDFDPDPTTVHISPEVGQGAFVHKINLIDYPKTTEEILIYPNPSEGPTSIFYPNYESEVNVQVFDYAGRLVKEFQLNQKLSSVDLSELAVGVNVLRFKTTDDFIMKKFVKY